ncbi:MAG TPA: LON peptidase substrate-binding domain-containing protein [Gammaproteobacteria bacterium]|nr:LON peptidase substrate-binding domain-containing protein [Gammaproteobacteria bacterium]
MTVRSEIPLFPLNTVLFPGGPLSLRIFEPRYLDMVAERMRSERPFGVCLIRDGEEAGDAATPYEVGTLARIIDFQKFDDGILGINAVGEGRFRVISTRVQSNQLVLGRVEMLPNEPEETLTQEYAAMSELVRTLIDRTGPLYHDLPKRYDDPTWLGYRLAEVLPIPLTRKQQFLELDNSLLRLDQIGDVLRAIAEAEGG